MCVCARAGACARVEGGGKRPCARLVHLRYIAYGVDDGGGGGGGGGGGDSSSGSNRSRRRLAWHSLYPV